MTSKREDREALIEKARLAYVEGWEAARRAPGASMAPHGTKSRAGIRAAFAVFEQALGEAASTPTDDEREARARILAKFERFPDADAVMLERRDVFTALRRPVQGEPTDAQVEAALQEWWYGEHEDTWEAKMRAALRAAFQEGETR